jgi:hypothetical protein
MKKFFSILVALLLCTSTFSLVANASELKAGEPDDEYISITMDEINQLEHVDGMIVSPPLIQPLSSSSDLIQGYSLTLAKNGTQLIIYGSTMCVSSVTKSGFTYIRLQRYVSGSWQNYSSYTEQYKNATSYTFSKAVSAASGYSYRVICEHYAEKPYLLLFKTTQTISNQTGSLSF